MRRPITATPTAAPSANCESESIGLNLGEEAAKTISPRDGRRFLNLRPPSLSP
jgi:hypothetical protein